MIAVGEYNLSAKRDFFQAMPTTAMVLQTSLLRFGNVLISAYLSKL